jgi:hypothetical protein
MRKNMLRVMRDMETASKNARARLTINVDEIALSQALRCFLAEFVRALYSEVHA